MKNKIIVFLLILVFPLINVNAEKVINLHLFTRDSCPHCQAEEKFLKGYLKSEENIKLYTYEVGKNLDNRQKYYGVQKMLGKTSSGVPLLVIGNQMIVGFDENATGENIKTIINYYKKNPYRDLAGEKFNLVPVDETVILPNIDILEEQINVPGIGNIDPKSYSLPLLAVVIGLIDGFNPCAMWILIFLITLLFGMKNRKKMWALGLTFLGVSSLTYLLFMISWLNIASMLSKVSYIQIIIGVIALTFGTINIKNYLKSKREDTGCEVVDDNQRKKIMVKTKKIVLEKNFIISLVGIAALAVLVNVVELVCSLGLPVIYTQVLAMNDLSTTKYMAYILIYIFFFLLDDLIIFFIAMKTLKISAISNKYTKYSHLIGGLIMLIIGLLMIFKPDWLMFNF